MSDLTVQFDGAPVNVFFGESTVIAGQYANLAAASAASAEGSADLSESARDIAQAAVGVDYADAAAALAGATNGDKFTYWSGDEIVFATKTAGVLVTLAGPWIDADKIGLAAGGTLQDYANARFATVFDFMTTALRNKIAGNTAVAGDASAITSAVQTAIDTVKDLGGTLVFPAGLYWLNAAALIDRTYAAIGGGLYRGERNLLITGYGAEIRTVGAITAFEVRGGWIPNQNCQISGFTIYHRSNTTAVGGVRLIGAGLVTCIDISVVVNSGLAAGYAAFSCENATPSDPDTGCFWATFDHCTVRPWAGAEGNCAYGIRLIGAANAAVITNCTLSGSNTHVQLEPHAGQSYVPNAVLINGNSFEGPATSKAVRIVSNATYHASGCRITKNRFETINTAVELAGTATLSLVPTFMSGNYADTSITSYIVNPNGVALTCLDSGIGGSAGQTPFIMHNNRGLVVENEDAGYDAITAKVANSNSGFALERADGVRMGTWRYKNSIAGGVGSVLGGTYSPYRPFGLVACQGIATRDTPANNLCGAVIFSGGTTATVTFPVAEPNTSYELILQADSNVTVWWSSKATSGFTINSAAATSARVTWFLIRVG